MESVHLQNTTDAGLIIKSVSALFFLCYFFWTWVSTRIARQKCTLPSKAKRHASVASASKPSQQLVSCHCKYHEVNQISEKELILLLVDIRERLANIEGRMGIYPPRRVPEPPLPEPAPESQASEPSAS